MCHAHFAVIKIQLHFWQKYQVKKVFEDKFVFPKTILIGEPCTHQSVKYLNG